MIFIICLSSSTFANTSSFKILLTQLIFLTFFATSTFQKPPAIEHLLSSVSMSLLYIVPHSTQTFSLFFSLEFSLLVNNLHLSIKAVLVFSILLRMSFSQYRSSDTKLPTYLNCSGCFIICPSIHIFTVVTYRIEFFVR